MSTFKSVENTKETIKYYLQKNTAAVQKKFNEKLNSPLTKTDGFGHVYGFQEKGDIPNSQHFRLKIGRTKREDPEDRIKEWNGSTRFILYSVAHVKLESLAHTLFAYAHVKPVLGKKGVEWFEFNEPTPVQFIIASLDILFTHIYNQQQYEMTAMIPNKVVVGKNENVVEEKAKVNINKASVEELETLPGIGPILANRIIENRPFKTIANIMKVYKIGPETYKKIQGSICV
jgi:competence protein ComEA